MNEKKFIELINLYIDGEISPAELEELETEVANNARRRRTYHSYRRMQQASQVAYHRFGRALAETVDFKKYQVLARNSSQCLRRGLLCSVGALSAACVTVIAAVSVFQDAQWSSSSIHANPAEAGFGSVEVFEPGALDNETVLAQDLDLRSSNPVSFSNGAGATVDKKSEFFGNSRSDFNVSVQPASWGNDMHADAPTAVFRGRSSVDASKLASFQFQR